MIDAWTADLRGADAAFGPARIAAELTDGERRRGASFRFEPAARRFLRSRLVVRTLLARRLGEPPRRLRIGCAPSGKPFLVDHPSLHVSWSRSDDLLLVAVSEREPIGVDIERVRAIPSAGSVLATVCPGLLDDDAPVDPALFLSAWTLLEAAVKATGRGLAAGAGDVTLARTPGGSCTLNEIARCGARPWHGRAALLDGGVSDAATMAAVVTRHESPSLRVSRWSG